MAVSVLLVGVMASAFLNNEVTRRLATVPLATTTSPPAITTTTFVPRPATPPANKLEPPLVEEAASEPTTTTTAAPPPEVHQQANDIITTLDALPVKDEHNFGYSRYRFGLWTDADGDGCTVREDVIIKQSLVPVTKTAPCQIDSGRWYSLYEGAEVTDPSQIRTDHLVALAEAWRSGAWGWTDPQRNAYLNDVKNVDALLAVSVAASSDRDGRDPSDWLPTNQAFRCRYLQGWVDLKTVWELSVDAGEREAIAAAALDC